MSVSTAFTTTRFAACVGAALLLADPSGAHGQTLIADLSDHRIEITSGFTGADVLLFGTSGGEGDVVVVLRGPPEPLVVRRKARMFGLWLNRDNIVFTDAPGYYAVAASRPLADIAPMELLEDLSIGFDNVSLTLFEATSPEELGLFRAALLRNMAKIGLYSSATAPIKFVGSQLFRTRFDFPANVPTGLYHADVFLFVDGALVSRRTTALQISKTGFEAAMYSFSRYQPLLYGLVAVAVALMAGWTAGMVFRRG